MRYIVAGIILVLAIIVLLPSIMKMGKTLLQFVKQLR